MVFFAVVRCWQVQHIVCPSCPLRTKLSQLVVAPAIRTRTRLPLPAPSSGEPGKSSAFVSASPGVSVCQPQSLGTKEAQYGYADRGTVQSAALRCGHIQSGTKASVNINHKTGPQRSCLFLSSFFAQVDGSFACITLIMLNNVLLPAPEIPSWPALGFT